MNKPSPRISADDDVGPLDENGQQIWTPEEEAAITRLHREPDFWASIDEAIADVEAGRFISHEQMLAESAERRRLYLARRDS